MKSFFDSILKEKFDFYFYSHFLGLLVKNKEISKEEIKKIKLEYYADVSSLLSPEMKIIIKQIYSINGLEIYIHQYFLQQLNYADVTTQHKKLNNQSAAGAELDKMSANNIRKLYNIKGQ